MQTIAFCGGGTAGHVMPNLALIAELKSKFNCVYIGGDGIEKSLCEARGIPFYTVRTVKLRRDAVLKNLAVPFKLISCVRSAKKALDEIRPQLIFSKGGYAALPVVLAAPKTTPVICHESDFSPGLTTKLSKKKSKLVLCAFDSCAERFKDKGKYVGTPLDQALYRGARDRSAYGLAGLKPVLTVVGGSSGSTAINDCTVKALPELLKHFDVIHVTGKNKSGAQRRPGYCPIEFENNMPMLYAASDIVVTRAGANALTECIALKLPTLAVPLEKASRGDQLQNARYFGDKGAIKILRETDMTPATLASAVLGLYNSRSKYVSAAAALEVDGTKRICSVITDLLFLKKK